MNRSRFDKRAFFSDLWTWSSLVAITLLVVGVLWVFPSWLEASAYNHATGSHVTVWDAMFVDLRVQDGAKK